MSATSNTTPLEIGPTDFYPTGFYGIHLFENEYGDWYAYGHHEPRRLLAALNKAARTDGYGSLDGWKYESSKARIETTWGKNARENEMGIWWDPANEGERGAFPVTVFRS